jgi:hypothetical protein
LVETPSICLVPLRCPRCGDDVGIGAYDRAYVCRRCLSLWEEEAGSLIEKKVAWVDPGTGSFYYIPFWTFRMEAETPMGRIDDFHSYCGRIAFPELLDIKENRPLALFVMAAMVSVERYRLSVSRRLTYAQPRFEPGEARPGRIWGPYIDEERARNYARIIFISTLSEAYKGSPEFVRGLTIVLTRPRLLYVPFAERQNDFRDATGLITISRKLLPPEPAELCPW